jgi:hypothetical protein
MNRLSPFVCETLSIAASEISGLIVNTGSTI